MDDDQISPAMTMSGKRCIACVFFFFSSRRRHTRCSRDWSSDVCSSDLAAGEILVGEILGDVLEHRAVEGLAGREPDVAQRLLQILGLDVLVTGDLEALEDRKSTRLNFSHGYISYAVFCLKKKTPHIYTS